MFRQENASYEYAYSLYACNDLFRIPNVELAILHTGDNQSTGTFCVNIAPCETVESARIRSLLLLPATFKKQHAP